MRTNRPKNTPPLKIVTSGAKPTVTGCILAFNEEKRIEGAILNLRTLADRVVVIDNGSTDKTSEIARRLGAVVLKAERAKNFDAIRNLVIDESDSEWIFYQDADERLPAGLPAVLRRIIEEADAGLSAVSIPFKHYFCGKWIQHSGWWPGYTRPQLLRRGRFSYNARLHSGVTVDGQTVYLSAEDTSLAIDHHSYDDLTHYITKLNNYTDGETESLNADNGQHSWQAQLGSFVHDWQVYYERGRADLDGMHGFVLSFMSGFYRFAVRAKLWDLRRSAGRLNGDESVPASVPEMLEFMARVAQEGADQWCGGQYVCATAKHERVAADWLRAPSASGTPVGRKYRTGAPRIVGVILARNEGKRIEAAIKSLLRWVSSIIVIDNASDDDTAQIALKYTSNVIYAPLGKDFDGLRNLAIEAAEGEWLFFVDADEIVAPGLGDVIVRLVKERGAEFEAICFPFKNWFYGKWMQSATWWPGYKGPQLIKKGCFRYGERLHAGAIVDGRTLELPADDPELSIRHNAYDDIHHYITKLNTYTSGVAEYMMAGGHVSTWQAMLAHFVYEWQVHYDRGKAYEDGMHGFVQSFLCAFYQFVSRAKLWDIRRMAGEIVGDEAVPGTLREMLEFMARVSVEGPAKWLNPAERPLPIPHVPLLWRGPLLDASGYADDARSLVFGLIDAGEAIHIVPEAWGENLADLSHSQNETLSSITVPEGTPADLMVCNTLPSLVQRRPNARFQIVRTVFETDGLPPDVRNGSTIWTVCGCHPSSTKQALQVRG